MSLLTRTPSSLLHLTLTSLHRRSLSLSTVQALGRRGESESRGGRAGGGASSGRTAFGLIDGEGEAPDLRSRADYNPHAPKRGLRTGAGGRGKGRVGGSSRESSEARKAFERDEEPPHLAGDDVFDLGEEPPFSKGGRRPAPPPPRPFQSAYARPEREGAEAEQGRFNPRYTNPKDRLTASVHYSSSRFDGGIPTFDSEEVRAERQRKKAGLASRFKMPPGTSASLRDDVFKQTSNYTRTNEAQPSFINPRHRTSKLGEHSHSQKPTVDATQPFPWSEGPSPAWRVDDPEPMRDMGSRDPLLNLGIRPIIVSRLKTQFPEVVEPTAFQTALIQGILSGRDVAAKESTGEGKTFALLLALLSIERPDRHRTTILLMVPSATLAHQIYEWAARLIPLKSSIPSTIGCLLRPSLPSSPSLEQRRDALFAKPPHILITTPTALAALPELDIHALTQYVRVIAIDEADSLIFVPNGKETVATRERKKENPSRTVLLMRSIFARKASMKPSGTVGFVRKPQVVLISATLNRRFRHHVEQREKWIHPGVGTVHIPHDSHVGGMMPKVLLGLSDGRGGEGRFKGKVQHHVVVVSPSGGMRNLESEPILPLEPPLIPTVTDDGKPDTNVQPHLAEAIAELWALSEEQAQKDEEEEGGGGWTGNAKRRATLVVIPEGSRATQLSKDLRVFGLDARGIDMDSEEDRAEVMTRTGGPASNIKPSPPPFSSPTNSADFSSPIYIYSPSQLRGIDIPSLTQVLLLSPAIDTPSSYVHLSGRVGRMGRSGKVVVLVEGDAQDTEQQKEQRRLAAESANALREQVEGWAKLRRIERGEEEAVEGDNFERDGREGRVRRVMGPVGETERLARMVNEKVEGVEVERLEWVR